MAMTRTAALALNAGETPGTKCLIDKVNGFAFILAGNNLVKVTLSTFTRTAAVAITPTAHDIALNTDDGLVYVLYMTGAYPTYSTTIKAYNISDLSLAATSAAFNGSSTYTAIDQYRASMSYVDGALIVAATYVSLGFTPSHYGGGYSSVFKMMRLNPTTLASVATSAMYQGYKSSFVYSPTGNRILVFYRNFTTTTGEVKIFDADSLVLLDSQNLTINVLESLIDTERELIYAIGGNGASPTPNAVYTITSLTYAVSLIPGVVLINPHGLVKDPYSRDIYLTDVQSPSTILAISNDIVKESLTLPAGDNAILSIGVEGDLTGANAILYGPDGSAPSDVIKITSPYASYPPTLVFTCLPTMLNVAIDINLQSRNVTNFRVFRRVVGEADFTEIGQTTELRYIDNTVVDETEYDYKVQQYKDGAWDLESAIYTNICAWQPWIPCPPGIVNVTHDEEYGNTISWKYYPNNNCGEVINKKDGFKVYKKRSDATVFTLIETLPVELDATEYSMSDSDVETGFSYQYYITAYNSHRASAASKIVEILVP